MFIRCLVFGTVKGVGALALGGVILWQVVEHCSPAKGIAYVHVAKSKVNVMIDDETYWVETSWQAPIVCELRPGRHMCGCSRANTSFLNRNSPSTLARSLS
jgi:hypothetical protein